MLPGQKRKKKIVMSSVKTLKMVHILKNLKKHRLTVDNNNLAFLQYSAFFPDFFMSNKRLNLRLLVKREQGDSFIPCYG